MRNAYARRLFGANLLRLRQERGLTQEKLAELADLHTTYVSMLEHGVKSPTLDTMMRLAKALNVKTNDLLRELT